MEEALVLVPRTEDLVKGLSYTLSPSEQQKLIELAQMRERAADEYGHVDYEMHGSSLQRKHTGVCGEYCLACILGVEFDWSKPAHDVSAMKGRDKYDLVWRNNSIDVKSTEDGDRLVAKWAGGYSPDYYAMMRGPFPTYTYLGCMTGGELQRIERGGLRPNDRETTLTATLDELVANIPWKAL